VDINVLCNRRALLSVATLFCLGHGTVQAQESSWSGLVEVESGSSIQDGTVSESSVTLATVELGYEHFLNQDLSVAILLLHEDGDTEPAEIDHATINVNDVMGFNFSLGRQYLPFGSYNSSLLSDPLTLEIGETREAAIGVNKSIGLVTAEAYMFQGDAQPSSNAKIPDYMARLSIGDEGVISYSFDAYFISELGNSENMTAALANPGALEKSVSGAGLSAQLSISPITLDAECLSAINAYSSNDLGGSRPMACHFEAGLTSRIKSKETVFALGYGLTDEALSLELPQSRLSAAASVLAMQNMALSLEWAMDRDYSSNNGGSGDTNHQVTMQVAMEF
jgi:hypothetical protein